MIFLSRLAGLERCVSIGDSFITLDYDDPITGMRNPINPEYDSFLGCGNATTMGHLPSGFKIGLVEEIGN